MSAIASFYLVHHNHVTHLQEVAQQPVGHRKRTLLWLTISTSTLHDPFWDFLHSQAQELDPFRWSGSVFTHDVYHWLASQSIQLDAFGNLKLSDKLSQARNGFVVVYQHEGAQALRERLRTLAYRDHDILSFLTNHPTRTPNQSSVPIDAIMDAIVILQTWLEAVDESHIGLLIIG
jgi:hypothetical protein